MAMHRIILPLLALLVLEATIVWLPFNSELVGYQSGSKAAKTAGQITSNFHLVQEVPAKLLDAPSPKRRITHWWKSRKKLYANAPNCFAIRFANYDRANHGQLAVSSWQGGDHQRWLVQAAALKNGFRRFCPSAGLDHATSLRISIDGIDSRKDQAATVRLSKSALPPATINGQEAAGLGLSLQLQYFRRIGPAEILRLDRGAFAAICVLSLGIAMLVLLIVRKRHLGRSPPSSPG